MARLFVAAWPDESTRAALAALPRPDEPGVRWVAAANWHVTLRFLGDVEIESASSLLAGAHLDRRTARLGPHVERLDRRQVVVPVGGVDELAAQVHEATSTIGRPDRRRFRGHVTVARTRPDASCSTIGAAIDAEFEVREVALVESELEPSGARYTTVATWPTL